MPLVVSVMGFSRDELATLVARVGERDEVAMIELNVSCPNVESGLIMGADPGETALAVERVRPLTELPLIVKLTPNATDPAAVAAGGGRGRGRALADQHPQGHGARPGGGGPWLGAGSGGVSGPAIRAIALEQVASVSAAPRYRWWGWGASPPGVTQPTSWRPERAAWPSALRASGTPPPGAGSAPSWPRPAAPAAGRPARGRARPLRVGARGRVFP